MSFYRGLGCYCRVNWLIIDVARGMEITYETPKSEHLALFRLGERTYDHVLFLPSKVKGG